MPKAVCCSHSDGIEGRNQNHGTGRTDCISIPILFAGKLFWVELRNRTWNWNHKWDCSGTGTIAGLGLGLADCVTLLRAALRQMGRRTTERRTETEGRTDADATGRRRRRGGAECARDRERKQAAIRGVVRRSRERNFGSLHCCDSSSRKGLVFMFWCFTGIG